MTGSQNNPSASTPASKTTSDNQGLPTSRPVSTARLNRRSWNLPPSIPGSPFRRLTTPARNAWKTSPLVKSSNATSTGPTSTSSLDTQSHAPKHPTKLQLSTADDDTDDVVSWIQSMKLKARGILKLEVEQEKQFYDDLERDRKLVEEHHDANFEEFEKLRAILEDQDHDHSDKEIPSNTGPSHTDEMIDLMDSEEEDNLEDYDSEAGSNGEDLADTGNQFSDIDEVIELSDEEETDDSDEPHYDPEEFKNETSEFNAVPQTESMYPRRTEQTQSAPITLDSDSDANLSYDEYQDNGEEGEVEGSASYGSYESEEPVEDAAEENSSYGSYVSEEAVEEQTQHPAEHEYQATNFEMLANAAMVVSADYPESDEEHNEEVCDEPHEMSEDDDVETEVHGLLEAKAHEQDQQIETEADHQSYIEVISSVSDDNIYAEEVEDGDSGSEMAEPSIEEPVAAVTTTHEVAEETSDMVAEPADVPVVSEVETVLSGEAEVQVEPEVEEPAEVDPVPSAQDQQTPDEAVIDTDSGSEDIADLEAEAVNREDDADASKTSDQEKADGSVYYDSDNEAYRSPSHSMFGSITNDVLSFNDYNGGSPVDSTGSVLEKDELEEVIKSTGSASPLYRREETNTKEPEDVHADEAREVDEVDEVDEDDEDDEYAGNESFVSFIDAGVTRHHSPSLSFAEASEQFVNSLTPRHSASTKENIDSQLQSELKAKDPASHQFLNPDTRGTSSESSPKATSNAHDSITESISNAEENVFGTPTEALVDSIGAGIRDGLNDGLPAASDLVDSTLKATEKYQEIALGEPVEEFTSAVEDGIISSIRDTGTVLESTIENVQGVASDAVDKTLGESTEDFVTSVESGLVEVGEALKDASNAAAVFSDSVTGMTDDHEEEMITAPDFGIDNVTDVASNMFETALGESGLEMVTAVDGLAEEAVGTFVQDTVLDTTNENTTMSTALEDQTLLQDDSQLLNLESSTPLKKQPERAPLSTAPSTGSRLRNVFTAADISDDSAVDRESETHDSSTKDVPDLDSAEGTTNEAADSTRSATARAADSARHFVHDLAEASESFLEAPLEEAVDHTDKQDRIQSSSSGSKNGFIADAVEATRVGTKVVQETFAAPDETHEGDYVHDQLSSVVSRAASSIIGEATQLSRAADQMFTEAFGAPDDPNDSSSYEQGPVASHHVQDDAKRTPTPAASVSTRDSDGGVESSDNDPDIKAGSRSDKSKSGRSPLKRGWDYVFGKFRSPEKKARTDGGNYDVLSSTTSKLGDVPVLQVSPPADNHPDAEGPVAEEVLVGEPVIVDEPVIEEPVAEEPVVEEPVIEEPVVPESVIEGSVIEESVIEESVTEEPAADEPVTDEPVTEEPVIEKPVIEEPVIEEPIDEAPAAEELAVEDAVAESPLVNAEEKPVVDEQVVGEPVVEEPMAEELVAEEPFVEDQDPVMDEPVSEASDEVQAIVEPVGDTEEVDQETKEADRAHIVTFSSKSTHSKKTPATAAVRRRTRSTKVSEDVEDGDNDDELEKKISEIAKGEVEAPAMLRGLAIDYEFIENNIVIDRNRPGSRKSTDNAKQDFADADAPRDQDDESESSKVLTDTQPDGKSGHAELAKEENIEVPNAEEQDKEQTKSRSSSRQPTRGKRRGRKMLLEIPPEETTLELIEGMETGKIKSAPRRSSRRRAGMSQTEVADVDTAVAADADVVTDEGEKVEAPRGRGRNAKTQSDVKDGRVNKPGTTASKSRSRKRAASSTSRVTRSKTK